MSVITVKEYMCQKGSRIWTDSLTSFFFFFWVGEGRQGKENPSVIKLEEFSNVRQSNYQEDI